MTSVASGTRSKTKKVMDRSVEREQLVETENNLGVKDEHRIAVKLKNQWLSRRYRQNDAQQFPMRVREALSTVDYSMTTSMAQAVAQLAMIQKERNTERRRNQWEERGMGGQRNVTTNVRAMQGNRWQSSQPSVYLGRQYFENQVPYYRNGWNNREWRGSYGRSGYNSTFESGGGGWPDTRVPPPGYASRNGPQGSEVQ
ncbi:hypothetical protein KPH14_000962 [Odynerus spinipes]|uniref:Uncharacterized protein n=1 Tax=Odynerus spinipes TaxID=1348599 RepID=A0AAD9VL65_9HYME|nr:hypothetical protein KPH14_000962 [Odynerus spinipes]